MSRKSLILVVLFFGLLFSNAFKRDCYCQGSDSRPDQNHAGFTYDPQHPVYWKPIFVDGKAAQRNSHPDDKYARREAIANERIAHYTELGLWASIVGTFVIFVTLLYARKAVKEAEKTTRATQRSVEEAEKTTRALIESNNILIQTHNAEQRPWVSEVDPENRARG